MSDRTPLFFYSAWPLGYHNLEAERKAAGLVRAGYDVVYVAGVGVRNPRLSNLPKLLDRVRRKVQEGSRMRTAPEYPGVSSLSLLVVPPRQVPAVRRANGAWVERQLRRGLPRWPETVAWVRWPTPELVDALAHLQPALVVYECVDAYDLLPEWTPRWRAIHDEAEEALLAMADAVVVPSPVLAERFRGRGQEVRLVPHGVDLFPWQARAADAAGPPTLGFVGTLDYRLDGAVLKVVAERHPDWRIRLIGPVQWGFPSVAAALPNVTVESPVAHRDVGGILGEVDVGLMPYVNDAGYRAMCPIKALEFLAAGRPAVATPNPALEEYGDLLYFATTPDEFVSQIERALAEDSPERARARRAAAEARTWDHRVAELVDLLDGLRSRR